MVILAAIFSQAPLDSSFGSAIHLGPTIVTFALAAGWWIGGCAATALMVSGVRALFRREGLGVVWSHGWRAALLWVASLACCYIYNVWVEPR